MTKQSRLGGGGSVLLTYYPGERFERPFADLAQPGPAGLEAAADAALRELAGWGLATTDDAFARVLLDRGAKLRRHAHVHSRDLRSHPAPGEWASPQLPTGLHVTSWDRPLEEIAVVALAAYPPDHPDFSPRADLADVVAQDLRPYAESERLGPRMDASGLVADESGRLVALLLVSDRPGEAPDGGPWVVDVGRLPGRAYAGTGRALLQRALQRLTADGAASLSLAVTEGNPARRLYEDLGITHAYSAQTLILP